MGTAPNAALPEEEEAGVKGCTLYEASPKTCSCRKETNNTFGFASWSIRCKARMNRAGERRRGLLEQGCAPASGSA